VLAAAALAQAGVLFLTFVMGLSWSGWSYAVALLQALLLLGIFVVLANRRSWLSALVPVLSAVMSVGLFVLFVKVESDAACTADMHQATKQIMPLPGTHARFEGEVENGCIARFTVPTSAADSVLPHYRREFIRQDWEISAADTDVLVATKNGVVMSVEVPDGEPGIEGEGNLVVIVVGETPGSRGR